MIQTISILSMPAADLREYICEEAEKNPALEIVRDGLLETNAETVLPKSTVRAAAVSAGATTQSDAFQAFIESRPAHAQTLQNHLLEQLSLLPLERPARSLAEKIIGNLDRHGFHLVAPVTLLDPADPSETEALLKKCLDTVRRMDPVGTACTDVYESLFVQASVAGNAPPLAVFLLDGRLDVLGGMKPKNALKKITDLLHENAVLREQYHLPQKISLQDAENALEFIRRLDPFPARSFDSGQTIYISPDVYVTKADSDDENAPRESRFKVTFAHDKLPEISLSPAFSKILAGSQSTANKNNASGFAKTHIKEAQQFLEAVQQREQTIVKAAEAIVKAQIPFFEKGPQYLLPLRMKDIAEVIDVHETTVSRIANGKYIQCEWGLFEIRYFFSNQVSLLSSALKSKEGVKHELREVLQKYDEEARQNPGEKKLTDEALVQKLQERGITIARRTVAKYRRELDIDSSFTR